MVKLDSEARKEKIQFKEAKDATKQRSKEAKENIQSTREVVEESRKD